jgi:hypothetical protein
VENTKPPNNSKQPNNQKQPETGGARILLTFSVFDSFSGFGLLIENDKGFNGLHASSSVAFCFEFLIESNMDS